jgi:uncharacterized delta-60 repeat protein
MKSNIKFTTQIFIFTLALLAAYGQAHPWTSRTNGMMARAVAEQAPVRALAVAGDLDPAFGLGGKVVTDFGFGRDDQALALTIQRDGQIVVVGRSSIPNNGTDFSIARYNPDGTPDTSFGSGGKVTTDFFGGNDRATGVIVRPDGKIVVAGDAFNTNTGNVDFALALYNADGSPDTNFDIDGRLTTDLSLNDIVNALVLQPDGKIILAGSVLDNQFSKDFALVRYNADGTLDTGFGVSGKVITDFAHNSDEISALVLDTNGLILAAGFAGNTSTSRDFAVVRYHTDGSLDSTFGVGGKATTDFTNSTDEARGLALQPDGRIVVAGSAFNGTTLADFALARFNPDGTLDLGFGRGGKVRTDFSRNLDAPEAVVILDDGHIIVAGRSFKSGTGSDFALAGYAANGTLDTNFGTGGKLTTDFFGQTDQAFDMVLDSTGNAVVAGSATAVNANPDFAIARYLMPVLTPIIEQSSTVSTKER